MFKLALVVLLTALSCVPLRAADVLVPFETEQQSEMYHALLREYRCLKCQNQNLADSKAGLANDLRREIRSKVLAGKNKQDIDQYLVSRYGEFVLYRPRFSAKTAVLWVAPFVLLAIAILCAAVMIRRRQLTSVPVMASERDAAEFQNKLNKARQLLDE